ncbi:MAG TPA: hypothetical protein VHJ99_13340 [Candidatus Dormibacteraeota bacterium]|nr:hypothetical protein [Candidatus Dormibacteraeota bacterium]
MRREAWSRCAARIADDGVQTVERYLGLSRRQRKADKVSWLRERLIESGAIDRARNFASQLAAAANQEASHALDHLGDSPDREFLLALPSYLVGRNR